MIIFVLIILSITLLCGWYLYFRHSCTYWNRKGVASIQATFPAGNLLPILLKKENIVVWTINIYKHFKDRGQKHGGIYFFNRPIYFPIDPAIIKAILATHFENYFPSHGARISTKKVPPLARNIFFQNDETWKQIRSGLSPAFTPAKIKNVYSIFIELTDSFLKLLNNAVGKTDGDIEIKDIAVNHTADVLANAVLGLYANAVEDPTEEIYGIFKKIAEPPKLWEVIKLMFRNRGLDGPADFLELMFRKKEVEELFVRMAKEIVKLRDNGTIARDDFINALLKLRKQLGLTIEDISGQIYFIYMAGHETTATALTFALHSLAHHKDVQTRLRNEIAENLGTNFKKFSYDTLSTLPYLDAVIKGKFFVVF